MKNGLFKLAHSDLVKGSVVAILAGAILPILAIFQSEGFTVATANWSAIGVLAANGAIAGFAAYLVKNFFSTNDGAVLGAIGGPSDKA